MSILFQQTPANAVANATFVEVTKDKREVGLQIVPQRIMLTGRMDGAVTAFVEGDRLQVFDSDQVGKNFGFGSEIHAMSRFLSLGKSAFPVEVWAFPSIEDVADIVSGGSIVITASSPEAGTLALYIAGDVYNITVTTTDTATTIGDKIDAAILADANAIVTSTNTAGTVAFEATWLGSSGDDITIRVNQNGETLPGGVSVVITDMTGGTGETDVTGILAGVTDDDIFTIFVHNFVDATNLLLIEAWETTRWDPGVKKGFCAYTGIRGSLATAIALTSTRNSFISTIIGIQEVAEMGSQVAAAIGAQVAISAAINPSKQLHTKELNNITPPPKTDRWTYTERNSALKSNGCATIKVIAEKVVIDQLVNTYQTTAQSGSAPVIDRQVTTVNLLIAVIYDQDTYFTGQWGDALLANDSPELPEGFKIMTPNTMKNELINRYRLYLSRAWVEDLDSYIASLVTERDSINLERINAQQTIIKIGNLRITAILIDYNFASIG